MQQMDNVLTVWAKLVVSILDSNNDYQEMKRDRLI